MEYTLSPSPTNTYFSPPFTHPSTHSRSVIFLVPCSPSLCMALHIASLIRPLKVSAESAGAESSARAATHARVFRIYLPPDLSADSLQHKTRIVESLITDRESRPANSDPRTANCELRFIPEQQLWKDERDRR